MVRWIRSAGALLILPSVVNHLRFIPFESGGRTNVTGTDMFDLSRFGPRVLKPGEDVKDTINAESKFRLMYDLHRRQILAYCRRRANEQDALEATNETFFAAWRRIADAPEPGHALPWLYSTARGVLSNQRRSRDRYARLIQRTGALASTKPPSPETQVIYDREVALVDQALGTLRHRDREVLELHLWEELPHATIGAVLGISESAARKRFSRALNRIVAEVRRSAVSTRARREMT